MSVQYRALLETAGLLEETDRSIVRISGDRAADMLHGLLTNDVNRLAVGAGLYAFMLTPKGRPVAEMRLLRLESEFWMDMPASCLDSGLAHLRKYLPPIYARFEETDLCRLAVIGPLAAAAVDAWAGASGTEDLAPLEFRPLEVAGHRVLLARREVLEGPGFDFYVSEDARSDALSGLTTAVSEVGGLTVGGQDWEILRVERGVPLFGRDFTQDDLAQETGQDARAISFDKGCYTGQEVVARIHFRGHVNRILRGFRLAGQAGNVSLDAPQAVFEAERERGVVTSVVNSPRFGRIALGLARAEIEPGTLLGLEPSGAGVVELVELPFDAPVPPADIV